MQYAVISGSHRQDSQSEKISRYLMARVSALSSHECTLISLAQNPLPLWDEDFFQKTDRWQKLWNPIKETLQKADGIIVVSPEWHGMVPSGLKNFFMFCGGSDELAHKPGLIVGVSASMNGVYPISELRQFSGKNSRIVYTPDHLIIRNAPKVLNDGDAASDEDAYMRKRIDYTLKIFAQYGEALKQVRASGVVDLQAYPNGM